MIIAFSGLAGAGKDTACDHMVLQGYAKVALADEMKRVCARTLGFTEQQLWGPSYERGRPDSRLVRSHHDFSVLPKCRVCGASNNLTSGPCCLSARYALQLLGTEWGRHCYENIWVDAGIDTAKKLIESKAAYCGSKGVHPPTSGCDLPGAHSQINRCGVATAGVVFSDIRFVNELEVIRKVGGKLVRLKRNWPTLQEAVHRVRNPGTTEGHASESEQLLVPDDYFDLVIDNRTYESPRMMLDELDIEIRRKGWVV